MHLSAVALVVADYDAAIAFYTGPMGFTLVEDIDQGDGKRWVTVQPPGGQTRLLLAKAATPDQQAAIGNQTGGRVGFFLSVEDFDAEHARMTAAGVRFLETPRDEPYGKVAVFEDAFGNRWDLLQYR